MSKEKQIEEMSDEIREAVNGCSSYWSGLIAEHLYEQGYCKQSEGEWKERTIGNGWNWWSELTCSKCGVAFEDKYGEIPRRFCPNCGAKMKGGAE